MIRSVALALAVLPLGAAAQEAIIPDRTITVTGEGSSDQKPDLALVSLGVSQQADTAGAAMAAMGEGMTAVLGALAEAGIAPADIQTGQLTLEAAYDYNSSSSYPPVTGFIATETVDVRVREPARVGEVLDAVTGAGGNRVNGVSFQLEDQAAALDEARAAAVADARARAEVYAQAAGLALGDIRQIVEGGMSFGPPQPMFAARDAAEASVPVAPGQVSVTAVVSVTFALE